MLLSVGLGAAAVGDARLSPAGCRQCRPAGPSLRGSPTRTGPHYELTPPGPTARPARPWRWRCRRQSDADRRYRDAATVAELRASLSVGLSHRRPLRGGLGVSSPRAWTSRPSTCAETAAQSTADGPGCQTGPGAKLLPTVTAARAPPTKAAAVRKRSPASMTKPAQHHRGAQVAIGAATNKISAERSCYPSFSES
jgi:hypothetical protein